MKVQICYAPLSIHRPKHTREQSASCYKTRKKKSFTNQTHARIIRYENNINWCCYELFVTYNCFNCQIGTYSIQRHINWCWYDNVYVLLVIRHMKFVQMSYVKHKSLRSNRLWRQIIIRILNCFDWKKTKILSERSKTKSLNRRSIGFCLLFWEFLPKRQCILIGWNE